MTPAEIVTALIVQDDDGSYSLQFPKNENPVYEKMSKSRNNSISVDEAMGHTHNIDPRYHFVTLPPFYAKVDHNEIPVYRNRQDGYYYTYKCYGHIPVLLADKTSEYIPRFPSGPCNGVQHYDKPEVQEILEE